MTEYELIKDHIDMRFESLEKELKRKHREDIERDRKIEKIEKKVLTFAILISLLINGPEAISILLKGIL